jgi:hypothetical protein
MGGRGREGETSMLYVIIGLFMPFRIAFFVIEFCV